MKIRNLLVCCLVIGFMVSIAAAPVMAARLAPGKMGLLGRVTAARSLMPLDVQAKTLYAQINGASMFETVKYLSDPARGGRQAGTQGNYDVTDYIAKKFAEWGLSPKGDSGTYLLNFNIDFSKPADPAEFKVSDLDPATFQPRTTIL